ncbi:hypothetical protein BBK36DRAFT_1143969 [Trichoderma citrinoviride]|uniref:Uncharacterized protein n=1 Tax=Trichoderma citrinoviride TaxID=58853 RepID=A0A2T4B2E8_9HYPO|nr:hypothetical protein BBK36DRAFT_1143969 [Trichoderma citrinoviride]PTB63497.1 hypothetical protein BBK36DRAFT_1143969 [Trichoderma citrinoviride]
MTRPVESASHKGQRRPDVPKCRRLQLEALSAGEVARSRGRWALSLSLALRRMCSASRRPDQPRCGASEEACALLHNEGSVKWHRVGDAHAQRRSEGYALASRATSASVTSAGFELQTRHRRSEMSR